MSHTKWTINDIPQQNGRSFVVTGTGGLGFEASLALCRAGAEVTIAGRNAVKGKEAAEKIREAIPSANIRFEQVDLASLRSVEAFAQRIRDQRSTLDVLINNAGIMALPSRQVTVDGMEAQFATNFLGAFALTMHLIPLLSRGNAPRVVMVSSLLANRGKVNFDDLQTARAYKPMEAYAQSKLADLIFALEFQTRSTAKGWGIQGIAAHPGIARTDIVKNGPGQASLFGFMLKVFPFMVQSSLQGSLPLLFAATAREANGGSYYGPGGFAGVRGHPAKAKIPTQALDRNINSRLWREALSLTGISDGNM